MQAHDALHDLTDKYRGGMYSRERAVACAETGRQFLVADTGTRQRVLIIVEVNEELKNVNRQWILLIAQKVYDGD